MKTLGELKVGDTFYIINWYDDNIDNNIIDSLEKHVVSNINEISYGKCVKWLDKYGKIRGITVIHGEFGLSICTSSYLTSICSDKEVAKDTIKQSLKKYKETCDKNLEVLDEDES